MRGKDGDSVHSRLPFRITPAYAGKRIYHKKCDLMGGDHPRLCGEKLYFVCCRGLAAGSPPPMRGKAEQNRFQIHRDGITPAYAGKRICRQCTHAGMWDHPRLCGEKCDPFRLSQAVSGSPPPMRGKAEIFQKDVNNYGITPAYAGKSSRSYVLYKFV